MRILLINQYAGSPSLGMEYRPHWMSLEWQKAGHDVLVVAGDHSHLRHDQPHVGVNVVDGVRYLTLRTLPYKSNGPRRFANILSFRGQLKWMTGPLARWQPDVVIASSTHPMDVRPAVQIADRAGARFVYEIHDLWPLTPRLLGGMSEAHPMIRWMQREEDFGCREADRAVSILPLTHEYMIAHGLAPDRWVHVSNGIPESWLEAEPSEGNMNRGPLRIGYFGGHGVSNDLAPFIEAARELRDVGIEFHLTGDGPLKPQLRARARDLPHVVFHDPVPLEEARTRMREMDALYFGSPHSRLYQYGVSPNKLFEYLATGLPVVQAIEPPWAPQVGESFVLSATAGDSGSIAQAIRTLLEMTPTARSSLGWSGRSYVEEHATYRVLATRFLEDPPIAVRDRVSAAR